MPSGVYVRTPEHEARRIAALKQSPKAIAARARMQEANRRAREMAKRLKAES